MNDIPLSNLSCQHQMLFSELYLADALNICDQILPQNILV